MGGLGGWRQGTPADYTPIPVGRTVEAVRHSLAGAAAGPLAVAVEVAGTEPTGIVVAHCTAGVEVVAVAVAAAVIAAEVGH